ncbi:MAG TPA: hemolysin III family protein, partial [Anaerolineales bacterium]|nr:hemolysin III family protein [Anaerolineales bacterium]
MIKKLREPVNSLTHLIAGVLALAGLVVLLILGWGSSGKVISLLVYGVSLVLLFFASGVYHAAQAKPDAMLRLRKFDHAAIYLLIAGTYTPLCFNMFNGFWKWGMLGIIWGLAILGIGVKIFYMNTPRWFSAGVYVLMGWLAIIGIRQIIAALPLGAIIWLIAGGIIFT